MKLPKISAGAVCVGALVVVTAGISGCSNSANAVQPDEAQMRASMSRKGPLDPNTVPPNLRAMVTGMMNASKKAPPPPSKKK